MLIKKIANNRINLANWLGIIMRETKYMRVSKAQEEINQTEWENPDNWSTIYFSKKDSRIWVPKRSTKSGFTINFGSRAGSRWIYYLFLLFLVLGGFFGAVIVFIMMKAY